MEPKVVLAGAGSTYFSVDFVTDLLSSEVTPIGTLTLFDVDPERLETTRGYASRLAQERGSGYRIETTTDRHQAVEGADFVVASIGVGGLEARQRDVEIALKYGVVQTSADTIGPGGISRGLRNVPAILDLARDVEALAPEAWLLNYSNPLSVICRAVARSTRAKVVGLCPGISHWIHSAAREFGVDRSEIEVRVAGLNHCSWLTRFRVRGRDAYGDLRAGWVKSGADPVNLALEELYGFFAMPGGHHAAEFFPYFTRADGEYPASFGLKPWDAARVIPVRQAHLARVQRQASGELPLGAPGNRPRDLAVQVIEEMIAKRNSLEFVNVPNRGSIPNLPEDAIVELVGTVSTTGVRALHAAPLPRAIAAAMTLCVAEQELTVEAALTGDRRVALQALMVNPAVGSIARAREMLNELLAAHADHLPQFRK